MHLLFTCIYYDVINPQFFFTATDKLNELV
jgi:hypothetical protein